MTRHGTILESVLVGLGLSVILIVLLNLSLRPEVDRSVKSAPLSEYAAAGLPQQEESPAGLELRVMDSTPNVPSAVQVEVGREVLCLLTIVYTEITFYEYKPDVPIRLSKFFLTLFRTVISPNAP